jgi:hypothetical protein
MLLGRDVSHGYADLLSGQVRGVPQPAAPGALPESQPAARESIVSAVA